MFESLTDKLGGVFGKLGRRGTLTEKDLDEALREVRLALLEADVNYKVARDFIKAVKARALTDAVVQSINPTQQAINIIHEELVALLGGEAPRIQRASHPPTIIMLVGLQGAGKTTTAAKLAVHMRRAGDRPLLIAADVYRPAAIEQLKQLGAQLELDVFEEGQSDPREIIEHGLAEAKRLGSVIVIVDTAGRLHVDDEMMQEIRDLKSRFEPHEVLLVADSMAGQDAVSAAEAFHQAVEISGVVLTKIDGDARGGAALSIRAVTGAPIKFLGTGERADEFELFHPDRLAGRILGQGDLATLAERAQAEFGEEDAATLQKRMQDGTFGLDDFLEQYKRVENMGSISQLLSMIPGMGNIKQQLDVDSLDEGFFSRVEAIISSMTPHERSHPEVIKGSRKRRISAGSGTSPQDVNQLLNQFKEAKKIMKAVSSGKMGGLLAGSR